MLRRYAGGMSTNTPSPRPIISEEFPNKTLVETLYDADAERTMLAICRPDGTVTTAPDFIYGENSQIVPYSPQNGLLKSGCLLLPSHVGNFTSKEDLLADIRAYFHQYVDLSLGFEEIAAHYVLLTWVYDAFNELPYLRWRGDYGTGKSRALLTVGSICYKPFLASGASTVSPIFHILDATGGTLILDEADFRFSDATAEIVKILNNGNQRGMPVLRTMANRHRELSPQAFRIYGPKLVGMRESYADRALESRFLTEETGRRPLRPNIPIYTPASLATDALALRNRLLAWRFHARFRVGPDPRRAVTGIEPRFNQTALALLSLVDDEQARARIGAELMEQATRAQEERASTSDALMLQALVEAFAATNMPHVPVKDIAHRFNRLTADDFDRSLTPKAIGHFIRTRLRLPTKKTNGLYTVHIEALPQIAALAKRYGVNIAVLNKAA